MSHEYDNEDFDDAVTKLIPAHVAAIKAKLAAGDAALCADVYDALSMLTSAQWEAMIPATVRGENAFQTAMNKVIGDMAEVLAIKEVEDGIADTKEEFTVPETYRDVREWYRPAL